jgi:uncharacterized protein YndB with AHSA1/START domain
MSQADAISVSRKIPASPDVVFALLSDPTKHPEIDGSGMLRSATSNGAITGVGDAFTMRMHNDEMGDYEMINHVVEYEPNRRIAWEPVLFRAGRPADDEDVGVRAGHRWIYQLEPLSSDVTLVTESYDCSDAPAWLQKAVQGGKRWQASMEASLQKIEHRCAGPIG